MLCPLLFFFCESYTQIHGFQAQTYTIFYMQNLYQSACLEGADSVTTKRTDSHLMSAHLFDLHRLDIVIQPCPSSYATLLLLSDVMHLPLFFNN